MNDMNLTFGHHLAKIGEENHKIVVLDADLNSSTKTMYFAEKVPERFIQLGIAEQNMVGVAAGLTLTEDIVAIPVTFATFASKRVCDQASVSVAYQKANVKLIGTYAGVSQGKGGATHQSVEDIAIMRAIPNFNVASPGWPGEVKEILDAAVSKEGPVYIRIEHGTFDDIKMPSVFEWGKARIIKEPEDITIVTTGTMVQHALKAINTLEKEGYKVGLIHCSSLEPFDEEAIVSCCEKSKAIITVENHGINGGLGDAVSNIVCQNNPIPVLRMGIKRTFGQTAKDNKYLYKLHKLTAEDIAENYMSLMSKIKK